VARIGIAEITLVTVVLLVLAPDAIPKVLRTIGRYMGALRRMSREVEEQFITPIMGESASRSHRRERGEETRRDPFRESADAKLRRLEQYAGDYQPQHGRHALLLLLDDDPSTRRKAQEVLKLDPLFAFDRRRLSPLIEEPTRPLFPIERYFRADRIRELSDTIGSVPDDRLERNLDSLINLGGIVGLDHARIFKGSKEALKDRFLQMRARSEQKRFPLQLLIAPSYHCTLGCGYCFTHALDRRFPREMSAAELGEVIDRAGRPSPLQRVGLMGGEPTASPRIMEYIGEIERRGVSFYLATNGLAPLDVFTRIVASSRCAMVTFHVEKDSFYREGQTARLLENIRAVDQNRVTIVLRYNLSDRDNRDWTFFKKYLDQCTRPNVSFAVVFPSRADRNSHTTLEELSAFGPKIVALVRFLSDATQGRMRRITFAKPFPPCLFDPADLKYVMRNAQLQTVCEIDRNGDTNNICVNPDGSFFPCMALNSEEFLFPRIEGFDALGERYHTAVRSVVGTPLLPQCGDCLLHAHGACQAACFAYM
jgi:sulfatase maturation enzyme AslB (radical SAM superfamily)/Sec-independent protein translocase protein TatA